MNKKIILISIIAIIIVGVGGFFVFRKLAPPEPRLPTREVGRCGDNICDESEKANPNACPADCGNENIEIPEKDNGQYKCPQYTPPAPSFYENCENKGGSVEAGEKNDKGCQMPPRCVLPGTSSKKGSETVNEDSPFGFHPGNAENYSYIKDLSSVWSREGVYLRWEWIDTNRSGNFKFTEATAPANKELSISSSKINYDEQWLNIPENINIVVNVCPFATGGEFSNSKEILIYKDFVKKMVERYDGDENHGCAFQSPDCYNAGDNQYPHIKVIDTFKKNPIKYWQVCNQLSETCSGKDCKETYAEKYAEVQETTYNAVKEADRVASVLIAGDSQKELYPEVFKKLDGKYIDIVDFHRFGNSYNPKEDFDYLKSNLRSAGFNTSKLKFWMTETGTYSGDPSFDPDKNLPYSSEKQQAKVLVKIYVSALSYKIEKIFWAWNIVEGFVRDGGIFDYTGLVYDGCDYINNEYKCGSNIGYDKGRGVKKLSYFTYKKLVEMLDGSDWNNIEAVQEKDGVYVYKFMKDGQPIWVAWNDNSVEKQINISNIDSSSVKITEAVPNYETGKEVKNYDTAFKTENKNIINNKLTITLDETPLFVEEN